MIVWILCGQVATAPVGTGNSVYASAALRELVTAAAAENRRLIEARPAFRARVESEWAWITQDSIDREAVFAVQQQASRVEWKGGAFDVHVVAGPRALHLTELSPMVPGLSWLIPAVTASNFLSSSSVACVPQQIGSASVS
jgi:hypothetical protein